MFTPFILFLGLAVATAIIAYWSDNLGKKLGKKRVSLFGLRPRTTATVLTITSSWAIMLFTLVFLLVAVAPLRRALFRYDRDRAQYKRDIGAAQEQLAGTKGRLIQIQKSFDSTRSQLESAKKQVEAAKKQVEVAQQNARQAEADGKKRAEVARKGEQRAREGAVRAQERADVAQKRFASAQAQYASAKNRLVAAQRRVEAAQSRETAARQGEADADELVRQAKLNLSRASLQLSSTGTILKSTTRNLSAAKKTLAATQKKVSDTEKIYRSASQQAFDAGKQLLKLESQRSQLLQQLDLYGRYTAQLEAGNIGISVGRTFSAGIIESGKSQKRIEENLRQLLIKGREALPALETPRGATLELLPLPEITGEKIIFIQGDAIFERLAKEIAKSEEATSVRLIAARNFLVGENQIEGRFVAVPVAPAFRLGEVIATEQIDGTSGDAGVFNRLQLLTDEGRAVAIERKVNPPQSLQEPNFYASGTNVALFAAMRRIEATGKTVQVRLVAADDLLTVEPLRVRFEIVEENGVPSTP